ncbi:uncharacterized protein K452DRAFT_228528 [Aplosporella prunicola CBS 121167]|uniref:peptidyl-tRNA hydrolase n=1 Tax=Aplosporella prunicola CBS 121167 TaxID=1176127 RepID=A0A6A6BCZ0_9PEZI|nr:uncharacterized protein K452DRAFT_228528 [Aplosporella prunicola CBS 121167]KAF2141233.1 hypothetical protein K452DRAFT_228528 [Aplosporella prunicola CBS 121167]
MATLERGITLTPAILWTVGAGILTGVVLSARAIYEAAYAKGLEEGRAEESAKQRAEEAEEEEEEEDVADSEDEAIPANPQDLDAFADRNEECKLVLVVRTDLKMGQGKVAAQCGHATLACYKAMLRYAPDSPVLRRWERAGQMKVALKCTSEEDMQMLQAQALSLGLNAQIIHDAGRTQIAAGSATVLGIGPGPVSVINQVTGQLKLL